MKKNTNNILKILCDRGAKFLGTQYPIMGGAMTWVSENNLVSSISNSGGFGVLACGAMNPEQLSREIDLTFKKTNKPFGVNIILMHPDIDELIKLCVKKKIGYVVLAGGFPKKNQILALKKNGIKALTFASTLGIAKKMVSYGIDALIIEGSEAGGHIGPISTNILAQEILPYVTEVPVFVAGGIGRGEILVNYLLMGASGCQIGTQFVCASESIAHENFKQIFINSDSRSAKVSVQLDERLPVIPVRAIANKASKEFIEEQKKVLLELEKGQISLKEARLNIEHFWSGALKKAVIDGDIENGSLMAGQSVSLVKRIEPVKSIISKILDDAEKHCDRIK